MRAAHPPKNDSKLGPKFMAQQIRLSDKQVTAFFDTQFEADQLSHFQSFFEAAYIDGVIVDVGGGVGKFASLLAEQRPNKIRVLDLDARSVEIVNESGNSRIEAMLADAINPPIYDDEAVVAINLILHHLVGENEAETRALQEAALSVWREKAEYIFVNEYIYESFIGNLSGRLIYAITSHPVLSVAASFFSKFVPSLRANTFGVGVRFRSNSEWIEVFNHCGYEVVGIRTGDREQISLPRRLLLISQIKRNSYLLRASSGRQK